jgi:hypothetical protein
MESDNDDGRRDSIAANLRDMHKRSKEIARIIDEVCADKDSLSDEDMAEINRRIIKLKKHFTTYRW